MASSAMKDLNVTLDEISLVTPADGELTRNHNRNDVYLLSNLDQLATGIVESLFWFKGTREMINDNPTEVMREALKKVLAFYYPLAGRLKRNSEGKLHVQCTGEGALFIKAHTDCCLEDITSPTANPDFSTQRKLAYSIPGADKNILLMPPLVIQVTRFKCGGLVVGVGTQHALCDGVSTLEFLRSWTETARGVATLSVPPFLDRTLLRPRSPPTVEFPHLEYSNIEDVVTLENEVSEYQYRYFSFGTENIQKLKKLAMEDGTLSLSECTKFRVISAHVWRCRTKALAIPPDQQVKLLFVMDMRRRLEPPLPKGYFGNAIYFPYTICTAGELLENGLSFGVGLIQKAIERVRDRYLRSAIDYFEVTGKELPLNNSTEIAAWSNIPFTTIDFGWGKPVQFGPATPPLHKHFIPFITRANDTTIDVLVGLPSFAMSLFEEYVRI